MVSFAAQPTAMGFFAPLRFEAEIHDCEVLGTLPKDLKGAFVRLGGDWLYPPTHPDDSPFNEDGYVSSFRFKDGRVDFRGRWVETERLRRDKAAQRQLYGCYRNPFTDDPSVRDPEHPNRRTVSNTTPLAFAGRLFTLKEDGLPYQIDPNTLKTLRQYDFEGQWKSQTFTAHTKIDPLSGEMLTYGYEATGLASNDVFVYTLDKVGKVTREARFKVPYVSMIHDIALTQSHVIFPVFGYVTSLERLKAGKLHWGWDSSKPTYIGIMRRDSDGSDIRWFKGPERCMVHTCNAVTEGSRVILEAPGGGWNPEKATAELGRLWRIEHVDFKPYACCRFLHSQVDCMVRLVAQHRFQPQQIDRVHSLGVPLPANPDKLNVRNQVDAQFSTPYMLAVAASNLPLDATCQSPDRLADPAIRQLMSRITWGKHPQTDNSRGEHPNSYIARVEVTVDKNTFVEETLYASGTSSAGLGLPDDLLARKFLSNASALLTTERAHQALETLWHLDELPHISQLIDQLTL